MTKLVRFDWAMKYLLRNKANFDILEGFLSELLKTPIYIDTVLESESNQNHADDKYNRVDVLVHTQDGQRIIVEVQCSSQWDYLSRILYGTSKVICEYLRQGDPYKNIGKVISVSIVFFNLGTGEDYLYQGHTVFKGIHCGDLLDLNPEERAFYEAAQLPLMRQTPTSIFPEYYLIKVTQFHERVQNKLDEWIYFLKNGEIKREFSAQGIQSASEKLNVLRLNEKERRAYEKFQESLHDEASFNEMVQLIERQAEEKAAEKIKEVQEKAQEAEEKAQEAQEKAQEAEEKVQEAEEKGMERGRRGERRQIALSLKQAGLSDEDIMRHTGLSSTELKELFPIPGTPAYTQP